MSTTSPFPVLRAVALAAVVLAAPLPGRADLPGIGGVQGVAATTDEGGFASRSAVETRSARVVPVLAPALQPIQSPAPTPLPEGLLRIWMPEFPDMRVPVGTRGRLNVAATRPGHIMLWSVAADGAVFPIADGITAGHDIVAVGPGRIAVLPADQSFEIAICPPHGQAVWFVLHSDMPIPPAARDRLARELSGARIDEPAGIARLHAAVATVVAGTPGWSARSHSMLYEILPGAADPGCPAAPDAAPTPAAPVTPAPPARPSSAMQPALPWLERGLAGIEVRLSASALRVDEMMEVHVRSPVACPSLTVIALGAGGAVDVLLPNARPLEHTPAPREWVRVPRLDSGIELRLRLPPAPGVEERIVALCDRAAAQSLFTRRSTDGPTTTLRPGEPEFVGLLHRIEEVRTSGRLLVGVATYTNLGSGSR